MAFFPEELSFLANLYSSGSLLVSQGGNLVLTPTHLIFRPNKLNFSKSVTKYPIAEVIGYEKGMLTLLTIKFRDGSKMKLAVTNKKEIINQIEARREALLS